MEFLFLFIAVVMACAALIRYGSLRTDVDQALAEWRSSVGNTSGVKIGFAG